MAMCGLCEKDDYLYSSKKFSKKICKECKEWLEGMKHLEA
jgi:hypothetical protein